mgnify:CR=1 FL=1
MNIYQENLIKDILQIIVFAGVIILWSLPYIKEFRSNKKKRNETRNKRSKKNIRNKSLKISINRELDKLDYRLKQIEVYLGIPKDERYNYLGI